MAKDEPEETDNYEPEAEGPGPKPIGDAETLPPAPGRGDGGDVPETVGPYRLVGRLGGGGMGTVYEAVDTSGRRVALKLVHPEQAASKETIERFRQEGELASKLSHPRCVFVLAADEDQGRPYIVMELMHGTTLSDLVKENGPLPPEQALGKILDVIEGLQEAHRLGLVHRDVKPSNCFLEADGRVKVGDFGLAKSLEREGHLTRTGTFLGTPTYAAPEQIKMEAVDAQSDLYSVAATLYFLLTGQPPFQTSDPIATMARIVADDPPSLRTLRPELPKALDKVVLRGLERDRKRRWRSLEDFRRALMPFLPAEPSVGGLGLRFAGNCIDVLLLGVVGQGVEWVIAMLAGNEMPLAATELIETGLSLGYYGALEGIWGRSLGKRLLRLRVSTLGGNRPPGVGRGMLRAAIFCILPEFAVVVYLLLFALGGLSTDQSLTYPKWAVVVIGTCAAYGLLLCTMRKRNGYRGLHEILSGTRTYRLHWPQVRKRRSLEAPEFELEVGQFPGLPEQVGAYRIRGAVHRTTREQVLLGDDVQLGRAVWVWVRAAGEPALDERRRSVNRATRVRWVSCGTLGDVQWDAFLAPSGCPLPALVGNGGRLSWGEFRAILEDLTEELRAACAEATVPHALPANQVWVRSDGTVQLAATPFGNAATGAESGQDLSAGDEERVLAFLGDVAVLALEGRARPAGVPRSPIQAPLPLHAAGFLNRLFPDPADSPRFGRDERQSSQQRSGQTLVPYKRVDQLQAALLATQTEPAEITRWMRARHLLRHAAIYAGLMVFALLGGALRLMHALTAPGDVSLEQNGATAKIVSGAIVGIVLFFLPVYLTRGGISFVWAGIAVVWSDGRRASRLRCVWRAFLSWAFIAVVVGVAVVGIEAASEMRWLRIGIAGAAATLCAGYVALTLWNPARAPHDFVAGTYLVPK
jgi:hypothetical protein